MLAVKNLFCVFRHKQIASNKGVFRLGIALKNYNKILTGRVVKLLHERSTTVALGREACGEENKFKNEQFTSLIVFINENV